ncbi:MAG: hypothetical protein ACR5K9_09320 [Wolbachia sp.]
MTDGLNLIIREIKDGQQRIEDLKSFLQPKTVNETPTDTNIRYWEDKWDML